MSAPSDRLIGEDAAERFQAEAAAVLTAPLISSMTESLAIAVLALTRDRQARIEFEATSRSAAI